MQKKHIIGGAVGVAAAAAAFAVFVLPADAGPQPTGVVGIGKVMGNPDEVKKQIEDGQHVYVPPSDPSFNPQPTSPPSQ